MAEFRTIKTSFWADPFIESLDFKTRLVYVYMITSPHVSNLGIMDITPRRMAWESGLPEEDAREALSVLQEAGKIMIEGSSVLMLNFIKHQTSGSPTVIAGLRRLFKQLESKKFRRALLDRYPFFTPSAADKTPDPEPQTETLSASTDTLPADDHMVSGDEDTLCIPYTYPMDTISDHIDTVSDPMHMVRSKGMGIGRGKGIGMGIGNKNKISCSSGDERESESDFSPPSNTDPPPEPPPPISQEEILDTSFEEFWSAYPRQVAKAEARKAFSVVVKRARSPTELADLLEAIQAHLYAYLDEIRVNEIKPRFVAYPARWLQRTEFSEPPEEVEEC